MAYYGGGYTDPTGGVFGGFPGGYNQTPGGLGLPVNPVLPGAVLPGVVASPMTGMGAFDPTNPLMQPGAVVTPLSSTIIDPTNHIVQTTNFAPGF